MFMRDACGWGSTPEKLYIFGKVDLFNQVSRPLLPSESWDRALHLCQSVSSVAGGAGRLGAQQDYFPAEPTSGLIMCMGVAGRVEVVHTFNPSALGRQSPAR